MRKSIIVFCIALSLCFCKNTTQTNVIIKPNNDTIISGEMFVAELYVPNNPDILPAFYIIKDNDTLGLEIDAVKKCAIFRSLRTTVGEKNFYGYVEYIDLQGKRQKENFSFKYYVKQK